MEENGINLDKPVNTIKANMEDCIVAICHKTISINGWDMSHMFQSTKGKTILELSEMYKEKKDELSKFVSDNSDDVFSVKREVDMLTSEIYYLTNEITKRIVEN